MSSTRESRATRNKREKAQKRLLRSVGFDPSDPDHLRFDLRVFDGILHIGVDFSPLSADTSRYGGVCPA